MQQNLAVSAGQWQWRAIRAFHRTYFTAMTPNYIQECRTQTSFTAKRHSRTFKYVQQNSIGDALLNALWRLGGSTLL
jgi:hypothetical protein